MSLTSIVLAFAPGLAVRHWPRSGPKSEPDVQHARRQSPPNCVPGRHAFLAPRDSGNLGRFLGPGFPGRI
jgi:hypothetical protein